MGKPQVVDVDSSEVSVTLIETHGETFRLVVRPHGAPDARRSTEFRIVGVEPRVWWVNGTGGDGGPGDGLDGVTTDVRAHFVLVRMPLVAADLEFTPSSY